MREKTYHLYLNEEERSRVIQFNGFSVKKVSGILKKSSVR